MVKNIRGHKRLCSRCKIKKYLKYFHKCSIKRFGRHYTCKECIKKYRKRWVRNGGKAAVEIFYRKEKEKPCSDCNKCYPYYVMQFDHVRGRKKYSIAAIRNGSISRLKIELAKCDLVCSNCHAERSYKRLMKDKKKYIKRRIKKFGW